MAGSKITVPATADPTSTDWQNFIAWVEDVQIGKINMSFSNMANTSEPKIQGGSRVEVNGVLYWFETEEAATGWAGISNNTQAYMVVVPSGDDITAEWTDTTPVWSDSKQAWYISGTNKRAVLRSWRDASGNYTVKSYYEVRYDSADDVSGDVRIIEDAWDIFESDFYAFVNNDLSLGTPITSVGSDDPCYIGNDEIVYQNTDDVDNALYKKSVNDASTGTKITSVEGRNPAYIGNGYIMYFNYGAAGSPLYKKSVNDTNTGTEIRDDVGGFCYIGNDEIVYANTSNGFNLYKKSVNDTNIGTQIGTVAAGDPCYIGNDEIVYANTDDADEALYKKSVNDTNTGVKITSIDSNAPCYIGNDEIVYTYHRTGYTYSLYKKSVNDTTDGDSLTDVWSSSPCYIGNGYVVYQDNTNNQYLYKKQVREGLLF